MKSVAVYGKYQSKIDKKEMFDLLSLLQENTNKIFLEDSICKEFVKIHPNFSKITCFKNSEDLKNNCDFMLSLGGDGTLLSAAMFVKDLEIPILGINTGRLGFLAGFTKEYFFQNLKSILDGNYIVSKRSGLQLNQPIGNGLENNFALNEVTIFRKETISLISIQVYLDGQFLNSFWADGLIVSTPTGSTGYSLSCGGPIVYPENNCFIITPVAPHNLNLRPIVIPDSCKIKLIVESRAKKYNLSLDSRIASFSVEQAVELQLATFSIHLLHNSSYTLAETLRQKMFWGRDSRS